MNIKITINSGRIACFNKLLIGNKNEDMKKILNYYFDSNIFHYN